MRRRSLLIALPLAAVPGLALAGEKKKSGGTSFIQLNTMTANVARIDGRRGVFTVEAGLDVPDPVLRERANGLLPRIRAAFNDTLSVFAASMRPQTAPDLDLLSKKLQADTNRVLGRPGARLLLGSCLVN